MNRKEFQEWLNQFPEDTEIEVGIQQEACAYQSYGEVDFVKFNGEEYEHYEFVDFTNNQFVKEDHPAFGKKILQLGEAK